jgi:uronate dehydrogenase
VAHRPHRTTAPRHLAQSGGVVQLFHRCLVASDVGFTICYGSSANPHGWWDTSQAERVGYPLDNAEHWAAQLDPTTAGVDDPGDGLQGGAYTRRQPSDQAG